MPIEHEGPLPGGRSATRAGSGSRRGWVERDDLAPCPECGHLLVQTFTEHRMAGRADPVRYTGSLQCRNGHEVAKQ